MAPTFYDDITGTRYLDVKEIEELVQTNVKDIRRGLKLMSEHLVLKPKMRVLGKGNYGIVIKSSIDGVVLKIMDIREKSDRRAFKYEVEMMRCVNQHTKRARIPIAPRYYKSFIISNKSIGVMAIQDLATVFPKSLKVETYTPAFKSEFKKTIKKLHKHGMGHGDLHSDNVYVATLPNDKHAVFFIDFGLSYLMEDFDTSGKGPKYPHPWMGVDIPTDISWLNN